MRLALRTHELVAQTGHPHPSQAREWTVELDLPFSRKGLQQLCSNPPLALRANFFANLPATSDR